MNEQKFWFIASSPIWPDDGLCEGIDPPMPVFYSTREKAEAQQQEWNEADWEDIPFDIPVDEEEDFTEQSTEDPPESPDLEVFAMEAWLLAEHLRDSDISHMKLDDEVISADDFLADFLN